MALPLQRLSELHKKQIRRMIEASAVPVDVRQPMRVSVGGNAVARVQGVKGRETEADTTKTKTINGLWTNDIVRPGVITGDSPSDQLAALGIGPDMTAVFRCMLEDALIQPTGSKQGRTVFDTAMDVFFDGQYFEVTGTKRTGRPPVGPYELWVGLKKSATKG